MRKVIILAVIFSLLFTFINVAEVQAYQPVSVSITSSKTTLKVGETFTISVDLEMEEVQTDNFFWTIIITSDSNLLELSNSTDAFWDVASFRGIVNKGSTIDAQALINEMITIPSHINLFNFTFKAQQAGTIYFNFVVCRVGIGGPEFPIETLTNTVVTITSKGDSQPPPPPPPPPPPENQPPVAKIEGPTFGYVNQTITFTAINSTDDSGIVSYLWNFSNNITYQTVKVNHIYTIVGNYTIQLTVTDRQGLTNTTQSLIQILPFPFPPITPPVNETNQTEPPIIPPVNNQTNNQSSDANRNKLDTTVRIILLVLILIVFLIVTLIYLRKKK